MDALSKEISTGSASSSEVIKESTRGESRFEYIKYIARSFPKAAQDYKPKEPWYKPWTWLNNQRKLLAAQQILVLLVLLLNCSLTIAGLTYPQRGNVGTLYEGQCDTSKTLNLWFHFLINVLSTIILGASNYCMQILASPTRSDIDKAHRKGISLEIGVPSITNLRHVERKKAFVWCLLGISSVLLNVLTSWNSAVFNSIPVYTYSSAIVTEDFFINDTPWTAAGKAWDFLRINGRDFERMAPLDCIRRYIEPTDTGKDLVAATNWSSNKPTFNDGSTLITAFRNPSAGLDWDTGQTWICMAGTSLEISCTRRDAESLAKNWTISNTWGQASDGTYPKWHATIQYCLSAGKAPENTNCGFHWSTVIMGLVCGLNFVKLICISYAAKWCREPCLITLGDAIAEFLHKPDETTRNMCLASKDHFSTKEWSDVPKEFISKDRQRLYSAVSRRRWAWTILICVIALVIPAGTFSIVLKGLDRMKLPKDLVSLWNLGLGQAQATLLIGSRIKVASNKSQTSAFFISVFYANMYQIVFSFLYLLYNSILTSLLVAVEWSKAGQTKTPLRVSQPKGLQRSSFFLSMPYRYGIFMTAFCTLIHWLVSQSLFLVQTAGFDSDGKRDYTFDASRVGYSPIAEVFVLPLGGIMILVLIFIGLKKLPSGSRIMPLASTSSAAISAGCHRPDEDTDAHLLPVQWGEVPTNTSSNIGHCSFTTSFDVKSPTENRLFA